MKKNLLFSLLVGMFVLPVYANDTLKTKKITLNLHIGGRWQSTPIVLPYSGSLPSGHGTLATSAMAPYIPEKNIQGFGIISGLEISMYNRVTISCKPVLRYDYVQSNNDYQNTKHIYKWIWDLHFNLGYVWKKNSIGLSYDIINAGKFINVGYGIPATPPSLKIEIPAFGIFYSRTFKKRWVAEVKAMFNYKDFPLNQDVFNTGQPIYKREYLILSFDCTYKIGLLK